MHYNVNNFNGNANGIQIQQGTVKSTQTSTSVDKTDYENILKFVDKVQEYDKFFDDEFGDRAIEVRKKITQIEALAQKRNNPGKLKNLLIELKNLLVGITGSIIATGIVELLKVLVK